MRTITVEEHYVSQAFLKSPGRKWYEANQSNVDLLKRLSDLDEHRIAEMDAAGIDVQVLSLHSPGVQQLDTAEAVELATEFNDSLADAIRRHPTRLAGFAALPTQDPVKAAEELERSVRELGFKGALINGHSRGRYLDDKFFWPILERAEALRVPLYIHPTIPPEPVVKAYYNGNFSPAVATRLSMGAWGWHIETAVHVLRLILSGAFDHYPTLQIIVGHLGESLPFMLPRTDRQLPPEMTKLNHTIGEYLRGNVHYSFSGFNFTPTFLDLMQEVGVSRIMFSADYPYGSMERARVFLEQLPLDPASKDQIAHANAEQLLGLPSA